MKTVNMETWNRKESFDFFKQYEYPYFNVCSQVEITKTFQYLDRHNISKYNAVLWLLCAAANNVTEIRYRIRKNSVVEHDRLDPAHTFLTDKKLIAFCTTEYTEDVPLFFKRVNRDKKATGANPDMKNAPDIDNLLYVSCVPWINFTSVSHPIKDSSNDSIPRICWGKLTHDREKITMPVSLQLHHALADGYHAGLFFNHLEKLLEQPESIKWPIE
ncbi:MAG: hypothetical protein GY857_02210 [Desulfobacula sp.]|nr:hypothetical protein [Desulfobacula sp.]